MVNRKDRPEVDFFGGKSSSGSCLTFFFLGVGVVTGSLARFLPFAELLEGCTSCVAGQG